MGGDVPNFESTALWSMTLADRDDPTLEHITSLRLIGANQA